MLQLLLGQLVGFAQLLDPGAVVLQGFLFNLGLLRRNAASLSLGHSLVSILLAKTNLLFKICQLLGPCFVHLAVRFGLFLEGQQLRFEHFKLLHLQQGQLL